MRRIHKHRASIQKDDAPQTRRKKKMPSKSGRVGRRTLYHPGLIPIAQKLCAKGLTDSEIAKHFGIATSTICVWKASYPEFDTVMQRSKDLADDMVEAAAFKSATGYEHEAVKIFLPASAKAPVIVPYTEHVQPNVQAQRLWLMNRRPDKWRERVEYKDVTPPDPISDQRRAQLLEKIFGFLEDKARGRSAAPAMVDVTPKVKNGGGNGHG